jgi:hypothetical protein
MAGNGWSNNIVSVIIIEEGTGFTGLFFYSPTVGAGNLVGSWAANAGTDPYGNPYPAGFMIQTGDSRIEINDVSGITTQAYVTGNPDVDFSAFVQAAASGLGIAQVDQWLVSSAQNSTYGDTAGVVVQSNNSENTNPAKAYLYWEGAPGGAGQHNYVTVSAAGGIISAGNVTGVEPGTGTSLTNPAAGETWHTPTLNAGFTTGGTPEDHAPRYRLEGIGGGVVRLDGVVLTSGSVSANAPMFTLPAGYRPTQRKRFTGVNSASGYTLGGTLVEVDTTGVVMIGTSAGGTEQVVLDGITFPVD